tara:strand:- start:2506 stop:2679 length:174 start_codon:yes stop_codon:yes gene_type:complete
MEGIKNKVKEIKANIKAKRKRRKKSREQKKIAKKAGAFKVGNRQGVGYSNIVNTTKK